MKCGESLYLKSVMPPEFPVTGICVRVNRVRYCQNNSNMADHVCAVVEGPNAKLSNYRQKT